VHVIQMHASRVFTLLLFVTVNFVATLKV
jgi:hypothetical protein